MDGTGYRSAPYDFGGVNAVIASAPNWGDTGSSDGGRFGGVQYADASSVFSADVMSDAGGSRVPSGISGVGLPYEGWQSYGPQKAVGEGAEFLVRGKRELLTQDDFRQLEIQERNAAGLEPSTGSALLDEGIQRAGGTVLGVAAIVHGGAQFASDQFWGLSNVLSGGRLAQNNSAVQAAVVRNTALGRLLVNLGRQAPGLALRTMTGNWDGMGQGISNALNLGQISSLNARGDYLGAQVLATQSAANVAGVVTGGYGALRATAGMGASVRVGAQLAVEDAAASGIGQRFGIGMDRLNYQLGTVNYVVAPQQRVMGWSEKIPETSPYVTPYDPQYPGRPDPAFSIDTSRFKSGTPTSGAGGGLRNSSAYWKTWAEQVPESLSAGNLRLAQRGLAPVIDQTWVSKFPQNAAYLGDDLIHHHTNFGQYAIPVPASTHTSSSGIWHLQGVK